MSFPSIFPCFTQNPLFVTNKELIGLPKTSASILNIFFCVAEIKGLKTITKNKPRIIETKKIGKVIFLIVKPVVLITISSFVLLTFITHSIPEKKKQLEKLAESNPYKREFLKDDIHSANEEGGLYIRQIQSEEQQYLDAVQEQLDTRNTMIGFGKGTSLSYVHRELLSWYTPLLNSIRKEVAEIEKFGKNVTDRVVDRKIYGPYLLLLSEEKLATITIDSVMSTIVKDLSNPAPLYALTKRIGDLIEIELHLTSLHFTSPFT